MKQAWTGIFITLIFLFTSCETVVDVDLPEFTPQLVVNSFFSPDTFFQVNVSRSVGILSTAGPRPVEDALVQLYKDDVPLETLNHTEDGWYTSLSRRPLSGARYKIVVSANGFQTVQASDTVPQAVPLLSATSQDTVGEWGQESKKITFEFSDPGGFENYYRLTLRYADFSGETTYYTPALFSSNDPALLSDISADLGDSENFFSGNYAVFSDILFNGKTYKMTVFVDYFRDEPNLTVVLSSISPDFYYYVLSDEKRQGSNDNPFAEPVQMHSNVQNGLGIFAGFASSRKSVE